VGHKLRHEYSWPVSEESFSKESLSVFDGFKFCRAKNPAGDNLSVSIHCASAWAPRDPLRPYSGVVQEPVTPSVMVSSVSRASRAGCGESLRVRGPNTLGSSGNRIWGMQRGPGRAISIFEGGASCLREKESFKPDHRAAFPQFEPKDAAGCSVRSMRDSFAVM